MSSNRNNFFGLGLVPGAASNTTPGDLEYLTSDGKLHIRGASIDDSIVQETLAATLTNKSISGATNTITAIPNTALTNSSITVNGSTIALGGTATVTATATNALTIGTGLTGTSYNGSSAVTVAIDATVVTLTGSQTLTNKTLTSAILNTPSSDTITGIGGNLALSAASTLTLTSAALRLNNLQVSGTTISDPTNTGITLTTGNAVFGINLNATGTASIQFQRAGIQVAYFDTAKLVLVNQNTLQLNDAGAGFISLKSPASVSTPYTITLPAATPATNTALVWNGTNYVWSTVSSGFTVTTLGTVGDGTAIALSTTNTLQSFLVTGTGGPVTIVGFSGPPPNGSIIRVVGNSDFGTVTLVNNDVSSGLIMNGNATLFQYNSIDFQYFSGIARYVEVARNF